MATLTVTHLKVNTVADGSDASIVRPSDWNASHVITPSAEPYTVLVGGANSTGALQQVANLGSSGQVLTSVGAGALPTWAVSSGGTPAALNTANDTNITIAASAASSAAVALLQAVTLTVGWTGTLPVSRGGAGASSYLAYSPIVAGSGSTTPFQSLASVGTSGQYLASQGTTLPQYKTISGAEITGAAVTVTTDTNISLAVSAPATTAALRAYSITAAWVGTATVSRGGSGVGSFTSYAVLCGGTTATGPLQQVSGLGSSGQVLTSAGTTALPSWVNASASPAVSTVQVFTSTGSGTYVRPVNVRQLRVRMVAGGGGGCGSGSSASGGAGGTGGNTTFSGATYTCNGGVGATPPVSTFGASGGNGGTASGGSIINISGGKGGASPATQAVTSAGGAGADTPFAAGGPAGISGGGAGSSGITNTGGGGGGGGASIGVDPGGGGGAGGYLETFIASPASSIAYSVGAGGTTGAAGTSGAAGGLGAAGMIVVEEYY